MKKYLNIVSVLILGIVLVPSFANATVLENKLLSDANGSISCTSGVEGSIAKNTPVSWNISGLDGYGEVLISWVGTGVSGASTQSVSTSYSASGLIDDVSVTLEDESGPLTIKCGALKIQKTLSENIGTNNLSCSSVSPLTKNTPTSWGINGLNLDDYGPVSISWSGAGLSGSAMTALSTGYTTAGLVSDASVTLEDESGPLTIKCDPLTILKTLSDSIGSNDLSCSPTESSLAKNITANWGISGLENYGPVSISWAGTVSGNSTTTSKIGGYSIAGLVSDTSVTLEDETGPLTIKCNPLTIKKSLSDAIETNDISCSPSTLSVRQNTSVTWGLSDLSSYGPISSIVWSGSGVSGNSLQSLVSNGYSTPGSVSDVSVTLEDESGPLTIKCNALDVTQTTTSGGPSGGGSVAPSCSRVGNINRDTKCNVDILDFNLLVLNWGSTSADNVADLNNDGVVDILDFNTLMLNWTGTL